ncbi:MAG: B12-binding domain-containing radical SAM protein [Clostridia bacterium]|nr:B12-binding domain-containing radical SAM protein [Clostridia bacterium]
MKILLITASSPHIRNIRKSRVINFQQITMPYLAARLPSHWEVEHIDEEVQEIDFDAPADLVGITFHTPSANHVYEISAKFKSKGIPVILGGPHVTLLPKEAKNHADVIFVGEAEELWEKFCSDFEKGKYERIYRQEKIPVLENIPQSKKDLFHRRDHSNGVLFATRGCPEKCDFCALTIMYKNKYRKRPIKEVASEFASFKGKVIIFWDDNIAGDIRYAKELFKAIAPAKKWWSSQAGIYAGKDEEFLELAAKSGCKQLFFGIESINQQSLNEVNKKCNQVEEYRSIIRKVHSYGISVQVGIIFGFDSDPKSVFQDTVDFLEEVGVQNATFNMLTPYPGTPLFNRLEREGRILTYDWSKYNGRVDVVYQPRMMSGAELLAGFNYANERFYTIKSIAKRLYQPPVGLWWTLPLNLAYYLSYKKYC